MGRALDLRPEEIQSLSTSVLSLARGLVHDEALAEDLVQETWLAALQHSPEANRSLFPWLSVVMRNFSRRHFRGESIRSRHETHQVATSPEDVSTEELVESSETVQILVEELRHLPDPIRAAMMLKYFRDWNSTAIAKHLGISASTARDRLAKGLHLLRERLDERHAGKRENWCRALIGTYGIDAMIKKTPYALLGIKVAAVAAIALITVPILVSRSNPEESGSSPLSSKDNPAIASESQEPSEATTPLPEDRRMAPSQSSERPTSPRRSFRIPRDQALVSLRVLDEQGTPVRDATLKWTLDDNRPARTNNRGEIELPLRPSSSNMKTTFTLSADGFATRLLALSVRLGEPTRGGDVTLIPASAIQGQVIDEGGRPVRGAMVFAAHEDAGVHDARTVRCGPLPWKQHVLPHTRSDEEGRFRLEGVPRTSIRVWACAPDSFFGCTSILTLEDREGPESTVPVHRLSTAQQVEGFVLGADSNPLENALVFCRAPNEDHAPQQSWPIEYTWLQEEQIAETDEQGRFQFWTRFDGVHEVEVDSPSGKGPVQSVLPGDRVIRIQMPH